VQAGENAISFDELHEKLLMFEASLQTTTKVVNPPPQRISPVAPIIGITSTMLADPRPTPQVEIDAPLPTNNTATQDKL